MKLRLLLENSIYLVVSSLEMQRRFKQMKLHTLKVFYSVQIFSSVYVIDITCFEKCFLFHVTTGRHYFYISLLHRDFFKRYIVAFFERSFLKEVCILRCLNNNSAVLKPNFQKKSYLILYLINFRNLF